MKNIVFNFFLLVITMGSCADIAQEVKTGRSNMKGEDSEKVEMTSFQEIIDSAGLSGAILLFDPQQNTYYSNDFEWADRGRLPASTFKIPNSIIALETGVVEDDSTLFKWDGESRRLSTWERDMVFRDAFHLSCVPCYQDVARRVGVERMRANLDKLQYGDMVFDSTSIDLFWLEGDSRISPSEQIDFLARFYHSELPISRRTESIMKRLMVMEETEDYKLSGKTGWSIRNGNNNGWFVGYLEIEDEIYFFATNVVPQEQFNMGFFAMIRTKITMEALRTLGFPV
jgi:beta-lactamase class D